MLERGRQADEKVKATFSSLSLSQLNWKPAEDSWSIGQCLDHLIVADCSYFPQFKKIASGNFRMKFWERWNPFNGLWGKIMVNYVQEKPRRKLKAPKIILPAAHDIDAVVLERFHKHLDTLLEYIAAYQKTDLDKTHITSPISKFITYSLRRAILLLMQHEHRHINQAIRVKQAKDFPLV